MHRQIILDTETTGIDASQGHRLIEIGCIEMIDRKLTDSHFHHYLNPEREVDEGAFRVHGISSDFLQDKPLFKDIVESFIAYVDGAELIIHNAPFDVSFIDAELARLQWPNSLSAHCKITDTLTMAKKKHPGQRNNLDALCKRYDIDNAHRTLHGALLDAQILAHVYLAMTGGQVQLFADDHLQEKTDRMVHKEAKPLTVNTPLIRVSDEEKERHQALIAFLVETSGKNLWD